MSSRLPELAPDLDLARRFVAHRPPPGEVLLCGITGSHHYGFTSADSDLDIKGIHQAPTSQLLALESVRQNHDALEIYEGVECDLTTNELRQAMKLLVAGNGNLLERIFSPHQLFEGDTLRALRELAGRSLSQASFSHYRGYFAGMKREHQRQRPPRAKSLLYSYRVALSGVHLLSRGEVCAHLPTLVEEHGFHEVLELIDVKRAGAEKEPVPPELAAALRARWPELEALLGQAHEHSSLPESCPNLPEIEAWVVERRRQQLLEEG